MSILTDHFSSKEYSRVFLKPADGANFIKNYIEQFDAKVEYAFCMPKLKDLWVVALVSPFGNISAVITESMAGFPEYLARTKILYWTKDMNKALAQAELSGMSVLQQKTAVPIGYQGRFETPGGYVVELAELSAEGEQYFNADLQALGIF